MSPPGTFSQPRPQPRPWAEPWRSSRTRRPFLNVNSIRSWNCRATAAAAAAVSVTVLLSFEVSGESAGASAAGIPGRTLLDSDADARAEAFWSVLSTESGLHQGGSDTSTLTFPVKDLECLSQNMEISTLESMTWKEVKLALHADVLSDRRSHDLARILALLLMAEPDICFLGITTSASFVLPYTRPKMRNLARTMHENHDPLMLNMTFYDGIRSGFPVYGVFDGHCTPEFRAWIVSEEGQSYFPAPPEPAACQTDVALAFQDQLERSRKDHEMERLAGLATAFLMQGSFAPEERCLVGEASAYLVWALAVAKPPAGSGEQGRVSAIRDIIELVTKAEILIRKARWEAGLTFPLLVASRWNVWWLLQRLQYPLAPLLDWVGFEDLQELFAEA